MSIFARALANSPLRWGLILGLILATGLGLSIALLPLTWAGLLVVAGVAGVVLLVEPQLGLVLLPFAVPFGDLVQVRLGVMNVGLSDALLGATLAAWLVRWSVFRQAERQAARRPVLALPLVLLVGAMLVSVLGTFSLQHSAKEIVKWLEVLALYLLVARDVSGGWRWVLVLAILASGMLAAWQGIYQFLLRVGPEEFLLFGRFMRAYGTFDQPNPYAGYLGLTLPLAVGLVAVAVLSAGPWPRGGRWLMAGLAAASGLCMLAALIMSWSRGAWLGFAAAVASMVLAVVARSGRGAVLIALLVAVVAYVLLGGGLAQVPPSLVQRFSDFAPYLGVLDVRGVEITDANFAVLERMAHWQSAWAMWTDHPWLGIGIGNYEPLYPRYALPLWPYALGHAHNYYLNIAAETGLLGLLAYVVLWSVALVAAWQAARRSTGWEWGLALGVLGVLAHLSVHNVFDNLYVHGMYLQLALLLGLLHNCSGLERQSGRGESVLISGEATVY